MDELTAYNLLLGVKETTAKVKKTGKNKITKDERIKKLRVKNKIKCNSKISKIPDPIKTFEELVSRYKISKDFLKCFSSMDYKCPTPVQMQSIPVMLENHSLFTVAPTGSGKTAAFLIPLIHQVMMRKRKTHINGVENNICSPTAVILSPTIELAKQTFHECICLLKEFTSENKPKVSVFFKKKSLNLKADIIICTPLRLKKTLEKENESYLDLKSLLWLVIDESDKMLEASINSFSQQFQTIYQKCQQKSGSCRVAMFSATQTGPAMDWVKQNLIEDDLIFVRIGVKDAAVDTVTQELRYCHNEEIKFYELKTLIIGGRLQVPCLIFMDRTNNAVFLHEFIKELGSKASINVEVISGQMTDSKRETVVGDFREGKIHFLICTNLLARGIDFKGVATVVNYDLPKQKEEYIHRIGRCGRAGQTGQAISFWTDDDVQNGLSDVLAVMKASNQSVNEELYEIVKKRRKQQQKRNSRGDKIIKRLQEKYKSEDLSGKKMSSRDMRRKMVVDKVVVRQKFLKKKHDVFSSENKD